MEVGTIDKFIELVKNYPELYQTGHEDYKIACKRECAWKKIHEQTGYNVTIMKAKWRNLRDTYRKYKQSLMPSGGPSSKKYAHWVWAEKMSFIDKYNQTDTSSDVELVTDTTSQTSNEEIREFTVTEIKIEEDLDETGEKEADLQDDNSSNKRHIEDTDEIIITTKRTNHNKKSKREKNKIVNTTNCAENLVQVACDRIDMEFLGYANSVKSLPLSRQAVVKFDITKVITQALLQEFAKNESNLVDNLNNRNDSLETYTLETTINIE